MPVLLAGTPVPGPGPWNFHILQPWLEESGRVWVEARTECSSQNGSPSFSPSGSAALSSLNWLRMAALNVGSCRPPGMPSSLRARQLVWSVFCLFGPPLEPARNLPEGLVPLGFLQVISEKPVAGAPRFWFWEAFLDWLRFPKSRRVAPVDLGVPGLEREVRVHVSVSESTRTAKEGALFQTEGLRFTSCPAGSGLSGALRLGLAVDVEGKDLRGIAGLSGFGGERRISAWRPVAKALPEVPAEILDGVLRHRAARLILLTPGCFEAGWRPGALGGATLEAAAVGRPDLVAGWDLHRRRPKPSRRMAPAGSVYFVRLPPEMTSEQMKAWVHSTWMSSLSDSDQDRRDGFGVAAVGVWDGQKAPFPGMGGKA